MRGKSQSREMAYLDNLPPDIRCFALVGQFFHAWARMESALHGAISSALSIDVDKVKILCANIEFGNKTYILRTLVDVASAFSKDDKQRFQKAIKELGEYAKVRNMVAHHPFEPDEATKGVKFLVVKARGKYDLPEEKWSPDQFGKERDAIDEYRSVLEQIKSVFDAQPLPPPEYERALRPYLDPYMGSDAWPMRRTMSPTLLLYLQSQAQDTPHATEKPQGE
jgi:hypothetical protein